MNTDAGASARFTVRGDVILKISGPLAFRMLKRRETAPRT